MLAEKMEDNPCMSAKILLGLPVVTMLLFAAPSAFACPPGTVFSAYKGNGVCLRKGEGNSVAYRCAKTAGSCPSYLVRRQKATDPKNVYWCPGRAAAPNCEEQCAPLKTGVSPPAEAHRVYQNCKMGCRGGDEFMCPDGRMVKTGKKC
jgi:hypothetical protein